MLLTAIVFGLALAQFVPFVRLAENWAKDVRTALLSPSEAQHPDVIIITVTEDTLASFSYRSPVDRRFLAELLEILEDAGARAVGLDILLDQPTEPDKDELLRTTLLRSAIPIVVAWADREDRLTERQLTYLNDSTTGLRRGLITLRIDDSQGTVRWTYPGRHTNGQYVLGLAAALAGEVGATARRDPEPLSYRAPPAAHMPAFRTFPAHFVASLPKEWLADKIALIGSDLPHVDRHRTPWVTTRGSEGTMSGVEIHAHMLAQMLDDREVAEMGWLGALLVIAGAALLGLLLAAVDAPLPMQSGITVGVLVGLWAIGFGSFAGGGPLVPLISPTLSFGLAFAAGNGYWKQKARRQRRFIREVFHRFTAPAVVDQLLADPSRVRVDGEWREITCVFTDLFGFTSFAEKAAPEATVATVNSYLKGLCAIALENGGTIDKIVGDALHVLFGAPLDQPDHPARAVKCALAMDAFGRSFAEKHGGSIGVTRIGVHSGDALVGIFGGDRFFNYTAYGDVVNTASRLEAANKLIGTTVCVSRETAGRCAGITFRPIGTLLLKGKENPVEAFEAVAAHAYSGDELRAYLEAFVAVRAGRPAAVSILERLYEIHKNDRLISFYVHRLRAGETGTLIAVDRA